MQNFEISLEDFSSNCEILLPALNAFTVDKEEYSLGVNFRINDVKTLKNLYNYCSFIWRFEIAKHTCWIMYVRLTKITLTLCCVSSDLIRRIWNYTYALDQQTKGPVNFQNQTSQFKIKITQDVTKKDTVGWCGTQ